MKIVFGLFLMMAATLTGASAQVKPDFSGTWLYSKNRSAIADQRLSKIERGVFVIEHKEPNFKVTRTFTIDGKENTLSFGFPTDGKGVVEEKQGFTQISSIYWEGNTLIFTTRYVLSDGEATNIVHYTLLDGGKTLLAEETFTKKGSKHHNLWMFEKE